MTVVIIVASVIIFLIARRMHGDVRYRVGTADRFEPCPHCQRPLTPIVHGQGEVITRGGHLVVRQYYTCPHCSVMVLWHRRLDQRLWTVNRSGVQDAPYSSTR